MTRDHALLKLLEHGPLHPGEMRFITGWPLDELRETVDRLREDGRIVPVFRGGGVYRLPETRQ
jgi:hypothetical protein